VILGTLFEFVRRGELARGQALHFHRAVRQRRQPHGNGVLGEAHDAEFAFAGYALVTLTVIQRDDLQIAAFGIGMGRPLRQRDLHLAAAGALHEHLPQGSVRIRALRVNHGRTPAEGAELARAYGRELPGTQRLVAQREHPARGRGRDLQGQEGEQHRQHRGETQHRHEDRARAGAASLGGRHFAVVVQPAESEDDAEQQAHRQDERKTLHRAECDELEHHAVRILALRRPL
jgi:hypothetical protein